MKHQIETTIHDAFSIAKIINVYYVELTPYKMEHNNPLVCFDYWQMLYVDRGKYTCNIDGQFYPLHEGQVLLCAPEGKRYVSEQVNACVAYISFRCESDRMALLKDKAISLSPDQKRLVSRIFSIGIEHFVDIDDQRDFFGQQIMQGTSDSKLQALKNSLELLLIELADAEEDKYTVPIPDNHVNYYRNQFELAERFMKQHITEQITVATLTEATGISKATIKRVFGQCCGMGAIRYFNVLKIKEAQRMIRTTDKTMTQISEDLGFSSIHYFSRIFKNITGLTPSQYGKAILQNE